MSRPMRRGRTTQCHNISNTSSSASEPLFSPETNMKMEAIEALHIAAHVDENADPPPPLVVATDDSGGSAPPSPQAALESSRPPRSARANEKMPQPPRRARSPARSRQLPTTTNTSAPRARKTASKTCGRLLGGVLLLALCVLSAMCAALFVAVVANAVPAPMARHARLLQVEPPCEVPVAEAMTYAFLELPAPPQCSWSWASFRCQPAFDCRMRLAWRPLPHPTCRMRPD